MPKHSVWKYGPSGPTPTTRYQNLEISSAEKKSKIKGNMTHYQHLDRPKPNSNKNLLLFLMPKHSVWKYGPSGPTPTTNFLSFWCRRILLGSTGHPVWIINGEDWTTKLGGQTKQIIRPAYICEENPQAWWVPGMEPEEERIKRSTFTS